MVVIITGIMAASREMRLQNFSDQRMEIISLDRGFLIPEHIACHSCKCSHHSPLTPLTTHSTHHSPLTTHHSPLTTHHSHHSPLTTHSTHHSPLTTHHSPLTTHSTHHSHHSHHLSLTTTRFTDLCLKITNELRFIR